MQSPEATNKKAEKLDYTKANISALQKLPHALSKGKLHTGEVWGGLGINLPRCDQRWSTEIDRHDGNSLQRSYYS